MLAGLTSDLITFFGETRHLENRGLYPNPKNETRDLERILIGAFDFSTGGFQPSFSSFSLKCFYVGQTHST